MRALLLASRLLLPPLPAAAPQEAGVGMMLLHLHLAERGGRDWRRLPDSPFP